MTAYEKLRTGLKRKPRAWLVTGAAGFIGSNIVETLLRLDQEVVERCNFETSQHEKLEDIRELTANASNRTSFWGTLSTVWSMSEPMHPVRKCPGLYSVHRV